MDMVLQKDYKHFTILWRENRVKFSVINKTFVTTSVPNRNFHLQLNLMWQWKVLVTVILKRIWREDILRCYTMLSDGCIPTFQNNVLLTSSWSKGKTSRKHKHAACCAYSLTLVIEVKHSLRKLVNIYHTAMGDMPCIAMYVQSYYDTGYYGFVLPFLCVHAKML